MESEGSQPTNQPANQPSEDGRPAAWQVVLNGCGSKPMVPFWGRCTTHFRTYFSEDWDVDWGYGFDFDPWPNGFPLLFPRKPYRHRIAAVQSPVHHELRSSAKLCATRNLGEVPCIGVFDRQCPEPFGNSMCFCLFFPLASVWDCFSNFEIL